MYALARYFMHSGFAALFSSLAYMYSGFMVGHTEHVTMIEVMAWMPLIFLYLEKAFSQEKLVYAAYAGLFLGISILAGHPQTSHAMGCFLVAYSFYRGLSLYLKTRNRKIILFCFYALAVCFVLGASLSAIQLLPTYEVTQEAARGKPVSLAVAEAGGQLALKDMISTILPNYFGALAGPFWGEIDISQHILYVGIISILLMGIAIVFDRKRPGVGFLSVMALMSLLLAMGTNGPLFTFFYSYIPGFHYFRGPVHTVFLYMFCASLLAGFGVNVLIAQSFRKKYVAIYLSCFVLCCITLYSIGKNPPDVFRDAGLNNIHKEFILASALVISAIILILVTIKFPKYKLFFLSILLLLSFGDLYLHFFNATTIAVKANPGIYEAPPPIINSLRANAGIQTSNLPGTQLNASEIENGLFRLYTKPEGIAGTVAVGINRAMTFRSFLVEGFEPLELQRHRTLLTELSKRNLTNLLKITASKYLIDYNTGKVQLYPTALPRAFIVFNARFIENDDQILERLSINDPSSEVLLSARGNDILGQDAVPSSWSVNIPHYEKNRAVLATHSNQDGFLVLSDTFFPGWHARIDGKETPIFRANYDFRAIVLPKGDHEVIFEYHPHLWPGVIISLITLLFTGFWIMRHVKKQM